MAIEIPNALHSFGSVKGSDGSKVSGSGFTSARSAKGTYTLTLDAGVAPAAATCIVTPRGAAALEAACAQTSDTVKTVTFLDNLGAAQDTDFDFLLLKAPAGN